MTTWLRVTVLLLALPAAIHAQDDAGWRLLAGGGVGATLYRGDQGDGHGPVGVMRLGVDRAVGPDLRIGAEWISSWLEGIGTESRHHLGVTGTMGFGGTPFRARAGLGLGTATVVEKDFPPPDGPPGDGLVTIGGYGSLNGTVGVEARVPLGAGLSVSPALDLLVQRGGGYSFVTGMLTARLALGGR